MEKRNEWVAIAVVAVVAMLIGVAIIAGVPPTEKKNQKTLLVAISSDVNNWYLEQFADGDARFVWAQVYGTLVRLDVDMSMVPGLASSWYTPDSGKNWIFNLTQGVKFHDGSELKASDVVYSYDRLKTIGEGYAYLATAGVKEVKAVDDYTVTFTLDQPNALFLPSLVRLYVLNEELVRHCWVGFVAGVVGWGGP